MSLRDIEKELGLDEALAVEASIVSIRVDNRRYGKAVTVLEGFDPAVDLKSLTKELKQKMGAGGTSHDGRIELQGDHVRDVREYLEKQGFRISR